MRPETPTVPDREALAAAVEDRAAAVDGRLGVFLALPRGPTVDDFEVLVARGADRPYASGSVIKLPVLYGLYRRYDGDLDALDDPHGLAERNRVGGAGLLHLLDDPSPSLRDLARATVAISDNAATNELIDHLGMDAVNEAAADLGMANTRLGRKMMTTLAGDEDGGAGHADPVNTTSPRDCARLFAALLDGDDLSERAREEQLAVLREQKDYSMFPRYVPYDLPCAHKPGRLPDAALDVGLVEPPDGPTLLFGVCCDRASNGGDATDVVAEVGDAALAWLRGRSG